MAAPQNGAPRFERSVIFRGTTAAVCFAPDVVIRVTPNFCVVDHPAPIPPGGCLIAINTPAGEVTAKVLRSHENRIVLEITETRWSLAPLQSPTLEAADCGDIQTGATDWVIIIEG